MKFLSFRSFGSLRSLRMTNGISAPVMTNVISAQDDKCMLMHSGRDDKCD